MKKYLFLVLAILLWLLGAFLALGIFNTSFEDSFDVFITLFFVMVLLPISFGVFFFIRFLNLIKNKKQREDNKQDIKAIITEKDSPIAEPTGEEIISPQETIDNLQRAIPKRQNIFQNKWKVTSIALCVVAVCCLFASCATVIAKNQNISKLQGNIKDLQKDISSLELEVTTLQSKVDEAAPWFEMTEAEQKEMEDEIAAQKAAEEEKAAAEAAAAAAAAEAAEKVGYDTGITYDQLARTPDDYMGQKVKFSGKVLQVTEGSTEVDIRLAINKDYDTVILCAYDPTIVTSRVLDDDIITIYGVSCGLYTYESTMGASITVPLVSVDKIAQ